MLSLHHSIMTMAVLHLMLSTTLFFALVVFVVSLTAPTDVAAIRAFKAEIDPTTIPSWSCLFTWNFTSGDDPCLIPRRRYFICGLSCNVDATRVTAITLDSVGYSGTISPSISELAYLIVLDLSDNNFNGAIPPEIFSGLFHLESLTLRQNSLSGHLPASVANLRLLEDLDVSGNLLSGSLPKSLFQLSNLNRLDLSFNRFSGSLPRLPLNLLELAARGNLLSGSLSQSSFEGMTQLEVIELSANAITGVLNPWFFSIPSLQQVNLSNNSLSVVEIWKPVNEFSPLVAVDLGFNQIIGKIPANFSEYPMLWSLSMRYNKLRGQIPMRFGTKGTLKRLYLDGNYLSGKPPPGLVYGKAAVDAGSLGYNCLEGCPASSKLCLESQKPLWLCKEMYGGKKPSL
ncbi:hypothetical protein Droror1_Dr00001381 [Drosera rotundifolia]